MSEGASHSPLRAKRVLILTLYYAPEHSGSAPYTTALAEHLAALGANVTVLTAPPHYPGWQLPAGTPKSWRRETRNGVRVWRLPVYVPARPTLLRRAFYECSYVATALPLLLPWLLRRPAVVIGCSPGLFAGALAAAFSRLTGRPCVQILQDLITSAAAQSGMAGARRLERLFSALESWTLATARRITLPTEAFMPAIKAMGIKPDTVAVVPNWSRQQPPNVVDTMQLREALQLREARGWSDRTVVVHAGNMGLKQGLEELAPTIRHLETECPSVRFVFLGAGSRAAALQEAVAGCANVEILPPVPDEEFLPLLSAADALLVHERSTVRDMSLPSKLTAYFAAGRPVLAVIRSDGATAAEVVRSQAGVLVAPGDPKSFLSAVRQLQDDPASGKALGSAGQRYSRETLGSSPALQRLTEVIEEAYQPVPDGAR